MKSTGSEGYRPPATPSVGDRTDAGLLRACHESLLHVFLPRLEAAVGRLSDEQYWRRANPVSNSVGNLVLHLEGNLRQWILAGLGGAPDTRVREREFTARGPGARKPALAALRKTVEASCRVIAGVDRENLHRVRRIQAYEVNGIEILLHATEHFSYHLGQIVFAVKAATNRDLRLIPHHPPAIQPDREESGLPGSAAPAP